MLAEVKDRARLYGVSPLYPSRNLGKFFSPIGFRSSHSIKHSEELGFAAIEIQSERFR